METTALDIDSPHDPSAEQVDLYRRDGFVKLPGVLASGALGHWRDLITGQVLALNEQRLPLEQRDTYGRAFLQIVNLWRRDDAVKRFVLGRRLARIAARLMGVRGVRIYHDQALYKEPGGGHTPWHADQYYWPLSTDRCTTAWIPLHSVSVDMGALAFAVASHRVEIARDLKIGDESEARIQEEIAAAGFAVECSDYRVGDVSFHSGWTFHRAGPNRTGEPRRVMTIIYMDAGMRLAPPANDNQVADRAAFCPGVAVGEVIDSPLNPVVWQE